MANTIEKFKKYIDKLDEVYKLASLTSDLDGDTTLVTMGANADEMNIPVLDMDGLGDYSRANGYFNGDVDFKFETKKFNYERGRTLSVDRMDNEETAGLAFGKLASEFVRTKAVPELDAFRFAVYAQKAIEAGNEVEGELSTGEDVVKALRTISNKMDEAEVPTENRFLYITPTLEGMIADLDTTKSKEVMDKFTLVKEVPQRRFYTKIELLSGDPSNTDKKKGGFAKASDGEEINFLVIVKESVIQYPKLVVNKAISPDENQTDDKWKFFYRTNGIAEVYDQKIDGIYCHHKASI